MSNHPYREAIVYRDPKPGNMSLAVAWWAFRYWLAVWRIERCACGLTWLHEDGHAGPARESSGVTTWCVAGHYARARRTWGSGPA